MLVHLFAGQVRNAVLEPGTAQRENFPGRFGVERRAQYDALFRVALTVAVQVADVFGELEQRRGEFWELLYE